MIRDIDFEQAMQLNNSLFIDLRSENEFQEDHIPNAINIPLFNNEERANVGTVYKNQGSKAARKLGLKIVTPKLPKIVQLIDDIANNSSIVLYCWRGGLRSQSLAVILDLMDIKGYRLIGGYKKFRNWIYAYFQQEKLGFEAIILHGLTGTGKTEIIKQLEKSQIGVIDLEGLANNRGSVFGSLGLSDQPTQKMFESLLWHKLEQNKDQRFIVVECESKRIGKLILPSLFYQTMKEGKHILVYDTLPNRVKRIISEYDPSTYKNQVLEALIKLKDRLGKDKINYLKNLVIEGKYQWVVEDLLICYYDPLYKYPDHPSTQYDLSVNAANIESAAEQIIKYLLT
ncbi:MAG: tRNA 2-selenouridine(34) synthase MnmH [Bacillota bacterium]|jgi:tRNA 2-selenouridine synthase